MYEWIISQIHVLSSFEKRRMMYLRCEYHFLTLKKSVLTINCFSTGKDELLETAMGLHEAAMKDEYFIKRRLAPNVDFW